MTGPGSQAEAVPCCGALAENAALQIRPGDLNDARVVDLLGVHAARAQAETARGSAHALDLAAFKKPGIALWTIWDGDTLLGSGALRRLSVSQGEVKSMHTVEAARRRGVGRAMLRHLIAEARAAGFSWLSLETGSWRYFSPAHALYRSFGFRECPPFGDYTDDPNSRFLTLDLRASP